MIHLVPLANTDCLVPVGAQPSYSWGSRGWATDALNDRVKDAVLAVRHSGAECAVRNFADVLSYADVQNALEDFQSAYWSINGELVPKAAFPRTNIYERVPEMGYFALIKWCADSTCETGRSKLYLLPYASDYFTVPTEIQSNDELKRHIEKQLKPDLVDTIAYRVLGAIFDAVGFGIFSTLIQASLKKDAKDQAEKLQAMRDLSEIGVFIHEFEIEAPPPPHTYSIAPSFTPNAEYLEALAASLEAMFGAPSNPPPAVTQPMNPALPPPVTAPANPVPPPVTQPMNPALPPVLGPVDTSDIVTDINRHQRASDIVWLLSLAGLFLF